MKIALASPVASTRKPQYGTETVVKNLATEFARRGHTVDLLIRPEPGFEPELDWADDSIRAIRLDARHKRTLARAIANYARKHRPDVIFSVARRDNLALCWAKPHLTTGTPVIISEHLAISDSLRDYHALKRWHRLRMMRRAYRAADAIVAVSQGIAGELHDFLHIPRERTSVIYNPIVTDSLTRMADEPLEHPWFQADQPPVIVAVGRLDPHKDFPTLLRAFALVRGKQPVRLVIIGEGWQRAQLQQLADELQISEHLQMPGFTANPFPYMRRAALLALSSRLEGFGNVLVEALACGTPVVATDCPHGPREILQGGRFGPLVPIGDHETLAAAIASTLTNPLPSRALKDRALDFSAEEISYRYRSLFKRLQNV